MSVDTRYLNSDSKAVLARKLDAGGWGLFLLWIGIAFLASLGWGAGLVGVAVITLGGQLARRYLGLPLERFSLVIGAAFLVGGMWQLLDLRVGTVALSGRFMPILFIVVGVFVLLSAVVGRPHDRTARSAR